MMVMIDMMISWSILSSRSLEERRKNEIVDVDSMELFWLERDFIDSLPYIAATIQLDIYVYDPIDGTATTQSTEPIHIHCLNECTMNSNYS